MRVALVMAAGLLFPAAAQADAPWVFSTGTHCGGDGPRDYAYWVSAPGYPVVEFLVGTNDLDISHYTGVIVPPGWSFTVEPAPAPPMRDGDGAFTPIGLYSSAYGSHSSAGQVRWWATGDIYAIESFEFGFDHEWMPEDVGRTLLCRRPGPPPEEFTFVEDWINAAVGEYYGAVHGPYAPRALNFGAEQLVEGAGGPIEVPGYSVPSYANWNDDGLPDLIVGQGGYDATDPNGAGTYPGKVRVYLNVGTAAQPAFGGYFFAQTTNGPSVSDISVSASGCQGAFPRLVFWDDDAYKDLLIGLADGRVAIYLNANNDNQAPLFAPQQIVQVGPPGGKVALDVGNRATPAFVDWNNDGHEDLVVGSYDAKVRLYLDEREPAATQPDFRVERLVYYDDGTTPLVVPAQRSSPEVGDFSDYLDDRKDLLSGNTEGQVLFFANTNTDADPLFGDAYLYARSLGTPIDLPPDPPTTGPRSRPFACLWADDDLWPDLLVGAGDGLVHLYQDPHKPGDMNCDGVVSFGDVNAFVYALVDRAAYHEYHPLCDVLNGDLNDSGATGFDDINLFVDLMLGL